MAGCCEHDLCETKTLERQQRRVLWVTLSLNGAMFLAEFIAGWLAGSTALMADSLDMFADAAVYGVSLYAVGHSLQLKARAAVLNGSLQWLLGLLILVEVGRRSWLGTAPEPVAMTVLGLLALLVNTTCFLLLTRFRKGDINLRATWICSRNDMIGNVGVVLAAGLVAWLNSPWPDRVVGFVMAVIILRSAWRILGEAVPLARRPSLTPPASAT
ncbi:cation transporter [Permianibacter sp. IMCC34836]|uniref:cation diffusion facilitator family transporter n=1 Tax=Permianibacter fluminis TaxID=2738515 RepID=UPI001555B284|nr:cation diffusion facilitator family transporter [Permianibacter fluminis]NQD38269.1 cation transporter [Permianibacter fluminis]